MSSRYEQLARTYWETYLPEQTASLPDPTSFFASLSEQVSDEVDSEAQSILDSMPKATDPSAKVGQRLQAIRDAEHRVLADLVFLTPEPGTEDLEMPMVHPTETAPA